MELLPIKDTLEDLFTTGNYGDLTVKCGLFTTQVHKAIVCTRSKWFANALNDGCFMEGERGVVTFSDEDPTAVRAAIEFLYTDDYGHGDHYQELFMSTGSEILWHLDVYAVADLIQHDRLKRRVETYFEELLEGYFENSTEVYNGDDNFAAIVRKVYRVAPPGSTGEALRKIVVTNAAQHAQTILKRDHQFKPMMEEVAAFGADLSVALSHRFQSIDDLLSLGTTLVCPDCGSEFIGRGSVSGMAARCPGGCKPSLFNPRSKLHDSGRSEGKVIFQCTNGHFFATSSHDEEFSCMYCERSVSETQSSR